MKIKYISDIHLEFYKPAVIPNLIRNIEPSSDEVLILAGDIGNPYSESYATFLEYVDRSFKRVYIILGNHEFYKHGESIEHTLEHVTTYFTKFANIKFLNNTCDFFEGYHFVGTTLWSTITDPRYKINDVHQIKGLDIHKYNALNRVSVKFLEDSMKELENVIIITHHVPSYSLIDSQYKTCEADKYNQWFYCNMDDFISQNRGKIKCWIYGHTHTASRTLIHDIPFVCNPMGYPGENYQVDFNKTIELQDVAAAAAEKN